MFAYPLVLHGCRRDVGEGTKNFLFPWHPYRAARYRLAQSIRKTSMAGGGSLSSASEEGWLQGRVHVYNLLKVGGSELARIPSMVPAAT